MVKVQGMVSAPSPETTKTTMPQPSTPVLHWSEALGHSPSDKRLEILRGIAAGGSISQAARDAGVSYKAAWQAIDTLSNLAGAELVQRAVGGAGGAGAAHQHAHSMAGHRDGAAPPGRRGAGAAEPGRAGSAAGLAHP